MTQDLVVGVVSTFVASILLFLAINLQQRLLKGRSRYVGDFYGYHVLSDGKTIIRWSVKMTYTLAGLRLDLQEINESGYRYRGGAFAVDGVLYANLDAKTHNARAFFVAKMPFNIGEKVYCFLALLTGINPNRDPGTTKLFVSRSPVDDETVRRELGSGPTFILINHLPSSVASRELIRPSSSESRTSS